MSAGGTVSTHGGWSRGKRLAGRFVVERQLGAGGMGVVYEAFDEQREEKIAIKTLERVDGASAYKLKKEFRALADLVHPSLVRLHELFADEDAGLFFTMARVDGVPFDAYARMAPFTAAGPLDDTVTTTFSAGVRAPELRAALAQLALGVQAIHRAGKIHRDLKPGNVLVARGGRVTILDFGLVEPAIPDVERSTDLAGTPSYMAPEQLKVGGACAASDWYAVGVMLYEAISGELPFPGDAQEVLLAKLSARAPRAMPRVPEGLEDLAALAIALLEPSPERRPSDGAIVAQLVSSTTIAESVPAVASSRGVAFVGREPEVARLQDAFAAVRAGESRTVWIEGTSGIGKSALVEHFLEKLRFSAAGADAIILSGRCYEREAVPFKAIDAVVDALSRTLTRMDPVAAARVRPRELDELCRVFPVLGRVPALGSTSRKHAVATDPEVVRRRAFGALRELFARLGDEWPVVVTIDDMQWGDVDSGRLLVQLVAPPDAPRLLFLGTYRHEDADRSPLLKLLREEARHDGHQAQSETIALAPLDEQAAIALAGARGAGDAERARRIAAESGGSPFFIAELSLAESATTSLSDLVSARVKRLPDDARTLLEVLAVAGRPVPLRTALAVARLAPHDDAAVPLLRASALLRASPDTIEAYHDRIREIVSGGVSTTRRREVHRALAHALAAIPDTPPDALYVHCVEGGLDTEARVHALAAARRARETFAFARASEMYQRALELIPEGDGEETRAITRDLADALALAGKGNLAADAYLRAADGASPDEVVELERRAGSELLIRGELDRGLALADKVMRRVGVWVPQSMVLSMVLAFAVLTYVNLRGVRPGGRRLGSTDPAEGRRFDALYTIGWSVASIEPARAVLAATRAALLGLRLAPERRTLGLIAAATATSMFTPGHPRVARWIAGAEEWFCASARDETTLAMYRGRCRMVEGTDAFLIGRWRRSRDLSREAETLLEGCLDVVAELQNARAFATWASFYLGDLKGYAAQTRTLAREARARGDVFMLNVAVNVWGPVVALARDDVTTARQDAQEAIAAWPGRHFQLQHYWHLLALGLIGLYEGDAGPLHDRFERDVAAVRATYILAIPLLRMQMLHLRGAAALALAARTPTRDARRGQLLRSAERHVERIDRLPVVGSPELAGLVRAGVAYLRGDHAVAEERLVSTIEGLERAEMRAYAMAAKRHLGLLRGGDAGRALVDEADAYFTGEGVKRPERFAAMLAPGFDA